MKFNKAQAALGVTGLGGTAAGFGLYLNSPNSSDIELLTSQKMEVTEENNRLKSENAVKGERVSELEEANEKLVGKVSVLEKTNKELDSALDGYMEKVEKLDGIGRYLKKDTKCIAAPNKSSNWDFLDITCDSVGAEFSGWIRANNSNPKFSEVETHYKERLNKTSIYSDYKYKL